MFWYLGRVCYGNNDAGTYTVFTERDLQSLPRGKMFKGVIIRRKIVKQATQGRIKCNAKDKHSHQSYTTKCVVIAYLLSWINDCTFLIFARFIGFSLIGQTGNCLICFSGKRISTTDMCPARKQWAGNITVFLSAVRILR